MKGMFKIADKAAMAVKEVSTIEWNFPLCRVRSVRGATGAE